MHLGLKEYETLGEAKSSTLVSRIEKKKKKQVNFQISFFSAASVETGREVQGVVHLHGDTSADQAVRKKKDPARFGVKIDDGLFEAGTISERSGRLFHLGIFFWGDICIIFIKFCVKNSPFSKPQYPVGAPTQQTLFLGQNYPGKD